MKTSKKLSEHIYLPCSKSLFSGFGGHLIPAAALTCALLALPLSGCFSPRPQQTKYLETVNTAASVYSEYDFGGDSLPFGVTLQVDKVSHRIPSHVTTSVKVIVIFQMVAQ